MGPRTVTPQSLLQMIPGQLLGLDPNNPLSAQIGQTLLMWLKSQVIEPMTGISPTDAIWNSTLYSNMTNFGTTMQSMNATANAQGAYNMLQMQASARYQFFEGLQRTAMSEAEWNKLSPEQRGMFKSYDAYIEHKAQGMMDNGILNMAMMNGIWDPTGKMMASFNMNDAAANVARNAMWRGDKDFAEKSDAVGQMFLDKEKKLNYRKSDYGMMTLNETSQLIAMLTRNMDFAADGDIEGAVSKLRQKAKDLTNAMSPLKDFFGDDIPKMVRFMEEISGQSLRQLNTNDVKNMVRNVANGVATGAYTAEQLQGMATQLSNTFSTMNTSNYMDIANVAVADRMLTATNAGFNPMMMSQASYRATVYDRTMRHAASSYADNVNLAYSVWEARKRRELGDKFDVNSGLEQFQAEYNQLRASGMNQEAALKELAQVDSMQALKREGLGYSGYARATRGGLGLDITTPEDIRKKSRSFVRRGRTQEDRDARQRVIDMLTDMNDERDIEDIVSEIMRGEFSGDATQEANARALIELQSDKRQKALVSDLFSSKQNRTDQIKRRNAEKIRKRSEAADKLFGSMAEHATDIGEMISDFIANNGKGFSRVENATKYGQQANIRELIQDLGLSEDEFKEINVVRQAVLDSGEGDQAEREKKSWDAVTNYLKSGITDPKRRKYLNPYLTGIRTATRPEDKASASRVFSAVSKLSTKALEAMNKSPEAADAFNNMLNDTDRAWAQTIEKYDGNWETLFKEGQYYVDSNGKMRDGRDLIDPNWREYKNDKEGAKKFAAAAEATKKAGMGKVVQEETEKIRISQLLSGGQSDDVDNAIKGATTILSDLLDNDTAKSLIKSYGEDVLIGGMTAEKWQEKNKDVLNKDKVGGEQQLAEIFNQLNKVATAVGTNSDVADTTGETKTTEQLLVQASEVLTTLDTTIGELKTTLGGLTTQLAYNAQGGSTAVATTTPAASGAAKKPHGASGSW